MNESKKCVHKGCGKTYTDDNEDCNYHPGPPEFHEGQKGTPSCADRNQKHTRRTVDTEMHQAGNAANRES